MNTKILRVFSSLALSVFFLAATIPSPILVLARQNLDFDCNNVTEIPAAECGALVALYTSTDGDEWVNRIGWLANNTPCSWYGVTCSTGHVSSLNLQNNGLSGSLPLLLGDLPGIISLKLGYNQLSGSLPPALGLPHRSAGAQFVR